MVGPSKEKRFVRPDLIDAPEFWVNLYGGVLSTLEADDDLSPEAVLGVTHEGYRAWFDGLASVPVSQDEFPVYSVPIDLGDLGELRVDYSMYPEDFEVRYHAVAPGRPENILLAIVGGHFRLPAFRWLEVGEAAATAKGLGRIREAAPLLLLPATSLTAEDDEEEVRSLLSSCWEHLGIVAPEHREAFVEATVDYAKSGGLCEPVEWHRDDRFGWVNDGKWSLRSVTRASETEEDARELDRIKRFFDGFASCESESG